MLGQPATLPTAAPLALPAPHNRRLSADGASVELVALRGVAPGEEATISYTGPAGMTNQRLMAQYGFVPTSGNRADRLQFLALQPAAADSGSSSEGEGGVGGAAPPALLSLERLQASLGDGERMAAALSGKDAYAYAALKSLPLAAEEGGAAPLAEQLALAQTLAAELAAEAASWPTSMERDAELAAQRQGGGAAMDPRLSAALDYRLQRKALVTSAALLLHGFEAAER